MCLRTRYYANSCVHCYGYIIGWTKGLKEGKEEGLKEGNEEGLKEGLKEGQLLLVDTVNRLNAGESEEQLLAQGIDQKTIEFALLICK